MEINGILHEPERVLILKSPENNKIITSKINMTNILQFNLRYKKHLKIYLNTDLKMNLVLI
jgi:hypothetical protein